MYALNGDRIFEKYFDDEKQYFSFPHNLSGKYDDLKSSLGLLEKEAASSGQKLIFQNTILEEKDAWFDTDVIVSAAPELFSHYDENIYRQVMTERVKRILDLAAKEKVEVLILGAFGCGAFNNPPEIVADIFASLIKNYSFDTVEFAVYCRNDTKNYDVFESRFAKL